MPLRSVLPTNPEERQFRPEEIQIQTQTETWAQSPKPWKTESPQLARRRESEGSEAHHEDVLAQGASRGKHTLLTCHGKEFSNVRRNISGQAHRLSQPPVLWQ